MGDHNYWSQTPGGQIGTTGVRVGFQTKINSRTRSGTLNRSSPAVRGWICPTVPGAAPHSLFATPLAHHATQILKVPKLVHLRFQQISDQITISSCSGILNRSSTAVRGWIWPRRARCSPLHGFAAPFVHCTTPDPQSTKVAMVHLGFQQISDQITISSCSGTSKRVLLALEFSHTTEYSPQPIRVLCIDLFLCLIISSPFFVDTSCATPTQTWIFLKSHSGLQATNKP